MRALYLLSVATLMALAPMAAAQKYKIDAGSAQAGAAPNTITGSYTLVSDPASGDPPLSIDGKQGVTGGGCLIFQSRAPRICEQEADCAVTNGDPGAWGYCLTTEPAVYRPGKHPGAALKHCWTKPSESYCLKFRDKFLDLGFQYALPTMPRQPAGMLTPVHWRVITCQNLKPGGCGVGGVEGTTKRSRLGKIFP